MPSILPDKAHGLQVLCLHVGAVAMMTYVLACLSASEPWTVSNSLPSWAPLGVWLTLALVGLFCLVWCGEVMGSSWSSRWCDVTVFSASSAPQRSISLPVVKPLQSELVFDTGAVKHYVRLSMLSLYRAQVCNRRRAPAGEVVLGFTGGSTAIHEIADVTFHLRNGGILHLRDARLTSTFPASLVSVSQLINDGYNSLLVPGGAVLFRTSNPRVVTAQALVNAHGLYIFDVIPTPLPGDSAVASTTLPVTMLPNDSLTPLSQRLEPGHQLLPSSVSQRSEPGRQLLASSSAPAPTLLTSSPSGVGASSTAGQKPVAATQSDDIVSTARISPTDSAPSQFSPAAQVVSLPPPPQPPPPAAPGLPNDQHNNRDSSVVHQPPCSVVMFYHVFFGHMSKSLLLLQPGVPQRVKRLLRQVSSVTCPLCALVRIHHSSPNPRRQTRSEVVNGLISMDEGGKVHVISTNGYSYYLVFVDEYSSYLQVLFTRSKRDNLQIILSMLTTMAQQVNKPIRRFKSDGAKSIDTKNMREALLRKGIQYCLTAPGRPEANGKVERFIHLIKQQTVLYLLQGNINLQFWDYVLVGVIYEFNHRTRKLPSSDVLYSNWSKYHNKQDNHIRPLPPGSLVIFRDLQPSRKFGPKGKPGVLLNTTLKGYAILDLSPSSKQRRVIVRATVKSFPTQFPLRIAGSFAHCSHFRLSASQKSTLTNDGFLLPPLTLPTTPPPTTASSSSSALLPAAPRCSPSSPKQSAATTDVGRLPSTVLGQVTAVAPPPAAVPPSEFASVSGRLGVGDSLRDSVTSLFPGAVYAPLVQSLFDNDTETPESSSTLAHASPTESALPSFDKWSSFHDSTTQLRDKAIHSSLPNKSLADAASHGSSSSIKDASQPSVEISPDAMQLHQARALSKDLSPASVPSAQLPSSAIPRTLSSPPVPVVLRRSRRVLRQPIVDYKSLHSKGDSSTSTSTESSSQQQMSEVALLSYFQCPQASSTESPYLTLPKALNYEHLCYLTSPGPKSYAAAMRSPESSNWADACDEELDNQLRNVAWDVVGLPEDVRISTVLRTVLILVTKFNEHGDLVKYKARVAVDGSGDTAQVYRECPTPTLRTVRLFMVLVLLLGWLCSQMDVTAAFLVPRVTRRILVHIPDCFRARLAPEISVIEDSGGTAVLRLNKALYGCTDAGNLWHRHFKVTMLSLGFTQVVLAPCFFYISNSKGVLQAIALLYVDDLALACSSARRLQALQVALKARYKMTSQPRLSFFIGIHVRFRKTAVHVSQSAYITTLLTRFGMSDCNPALVPAQRAILQPLGRQPTDRHRSPSPDAPTFIAEANLTDTFPYAELVGALWWIARATRPDISFAVWQCARYASCYGQRHITAAKRILRYLRGTLQLGLLYTREHPPGHTFSSTLLTDSEFAGDRSDVHSVGGWVTMIAGGAIGWSVKKGRTIAVSPADAELVMLSEGLREVKFMQNFLTEFMPTLYSGNTSFTDNADACATANSVLCTDRKKHMAIVDLFCKEAILRGYTDCTRIPSAVMTADIFTKPLSLELFSRHRRGLGLVTPSGDWLT